MQLTRVRHIANESTQDHNPQWSERTIREYTIGHTDSKQFFERVVHGGVLLSTRGKELSRAVKQTPGLRSVSMSELAQSIVIRVRVHNVLQWDDAEARLCKSIERCLGEAVTIDDMVKRFKLARTGEYGTEYVPVYA